MYIDHPLRTSSSAMYTWPLRMYPSGLRPSMKMAVRKSLRASVNCGAMLCWEGVDVARGRTTEGSRGSEVVCVRGGEGDRGPSQPGLQARALKCYTNGADQGRAWGQSDAVRNCRAVWERDCVLGGGCVRGRGL
jgi:hypothetical protein